MTKPELTSFNKLGPLFLQQFDRYLPTAFDNELTIVEKVNKVIQYMSQTGLLVDSVVDQWNTVMQWVLNDGLQDEVSEALDKWLDDGTIASLINEQKFNDLVDQFTNKLNEEVKNLNDKLDSIISASPVDVVETVSELNTKYPTGRTGIVVVKSDGYYYYYSNGQWNQGGQYVDPLSYPVFDRNGLTTNLNLSDAWRNNPDITTLKSGFYCAYIQTPGTPPTDPNSSTGSDPNGVPYPDPNYPIAINFPSQIKGNICTIEVVDTGLEGRVNYKVWVNWANTEYLSTKRFDGTVSEWVYNMVHSDSRPKQQFRLSYATGGNKSWQNSTKAPEQQGQDDLKVPIYTLDAGLIYGSINAPAIYPDTRGLPSDFPYGQVCTVLIQKSDSGRYAIFLHANYTSLSWIGYTDASGAGIRWNRIDKEVDKLESDKLSFAYRMNAINNSNFKTLITTDTHAQFGATATQIGYVNTGHLKNIDDLDELIDVNDVSLHLGDWMDGNNPKDLSKKSILKWGKQFYSKPNRYGIFGNHDYNGQWDNGVSGNNGANTKVPAYYFTKAELSKYLTPNNAPYYFIDNSVKKIRMIFLNSFDNSEIVGSDGKYVRDPHSAQGFGNTQVLWFRDTLNTVPSGYNVVIFTHDTFDNVFNDITYYNGDTMRKIAEGYQNRQSNTFSQSDITSIDPEWSYFNVNSSFNYTTATGKILAVVNGHRHVDDSTFVQGIRYISLLCSRAEAGSDPIKKPSRSYYDTTQEAITLLEFDTTANKVKLYRFGAGVENSYNMFS
jgi:hypothetical protein